MDIITLNHPHAGASGLNGVSLGGGLVFVTGTETMAGESVFLGVTYHLLQWLRPRTSLISELH